MGDHIIDTNVLLVASARDPNSPFQDSDHVPAEQQQRVLNWLMEFRQDGQRKIVLDLPFKIWDEYHNQMTRGQDIGSLVVAEKLQSAAVRFVDVAYDGNGHGRLPPELEPVVRDLSDRKFVAAALRDLLDGGMSTIVNAVDSDWCDWQEALRHHGVVVTHLIEGLCKERKPGRKKR
ncbi:MAG TPA: hypothetical protein VMS17_28195 [Gemmataceae bacterium]|nr:hypothetical protein [Gemmataceae bacterium]